MGGHIAPVRGDDWGFERFTPLYDESATNEPLKGIS